MKKILMFVLVSFISTAAMYALNPSDYNALYKLNNKAAFTSLIGYINADKDQANYLKHVFEVTENELKKAESTQSSNTIDLVLSYNLRNTKFILSEEQYKKYLSFVNYYLKDENSFMGIAEK